MIKKLSGLMHSIILYQRFAAHHVLFCDTGLRIKDADEAGRSSRKEKYLFPGIMANACPVADHPMAPLLQCNIAVLRARKLERGCVLCRLCRTSCSTQSAADMAPFPVPIPHRVIAIRLKYYVGTYYSSLFHGT